MSNLTLTPAEQLWLQKYQSALQKRHPNAVARMLIYGSKARGDANEHSDLDVLLLVHEPDRLKQHAMRRVGYKLAVCTPVYPSIQTYTPQEWAQGLRDEFPFYMEVEREAVAV